MTDIVPRIRFGLKVIDGGKAAPAAEDPIVKLRFDKTPHKPQKPLTPEEIVDLKILNGIEDGK